MKDLIRVVPDAVSLEIERRLVWKTQRAELVRLPTLEHYDARDVTRPSATPRQMIAVPRFCAVFDKKYIAWYEALGAGSFEHRNTACFTPGLERASFRGGGQECSLPPGAVQEEVCPWCGTSGHGAVKCDRCGGLVCYGRSDGQHYFRCRLSCRESGRIIDANYRTPGMVPNVR